MRRGNAHGCLSPDAAIGIHPPAFFKFLFPARTSGTLGGGAVLESDIPAPRHTITMGRNFLFECPRCGYRARVAGGESDGAWFVVRTIQCQDCGQLHDAVVKMRFPVPPLSGFKSLSGARRGMSPRIAPTFEAAVNRLPPTGVTRFRWVKFPLACPVSARHRINDWRHPGRCPKCGWFLETSALPFRTWE